MHLEGGGTDLTSFSVLLVWNLLELTDALMSHTKASEAKRTRATLHRGSFSQEKERHVISVKRDRFASELCTVCSTPAAPLARTATACSKRCVAPVF